MVLSLVSATQALYSTPTSEPDYDATLIKCYNSSLAERIETGGKTNLVVTRAMALFAFVPACATALGQTGYAVKIVTLIPLKKYTQLVGHNEDYSPETDAKVASEHAKRALKVAIYALTSTVLSLFGLVAPHVVTRLDAAFGATSDQAVVPLTTAEQLKRWCCAKKAATEQWAVKHKEIITLGTVAAVTAAVGVLYFWPDEAVTPPLDEDSIEDIEDLDTPPVDRSKGLADRNGHLIDPGEDLSGGPHEKLIIPGIAIAIAIATYVNARRCDKQRAVHVKIEELRTAFLKYSSDMSGETLTEDEIKKCAERTLNELEQEGIDGEGEDRDNYRYKVNQCILHLLRSLESQDPSNAQVWYCGFQHWLGKFREAGL